MSPSKHLPVTGRTKNGDEQETFGAVDLTDFDLSPENERWATETLRQMLQKPAGRARVPKSVKST